MRAGNYLACAGIVAASMLFASCEQRNYYNANPNPNNNNNNNNNNYNSNNPYVFDEEFNGPDVNNWTFTDATDSAYASISGGNYQYVDYSAKKSNMSVVNTGASVNNNFTVSTRIKSNNIMGLIFGASSTDNGYAFYIDTAGNYSLYKESNDSTASTIIIPSTSDSLSAIKNNWNTLEVDQTGGNWVGFINGTQVFQIAARPMSGPRCGFKVLPGTIGYADFLLVKSY